MKKLPSTISHQSTLFKLIPDEFTCLSATFSSQHAHPAVPTKRAGSMFVMDGEGVNQVPPDTDEQQGVFDEPTVQLQLDVEGNESPWSRSELGDGSGDGSLLVGEDMVLAIVDGDPVVINSLLKAANPPLDSSRAWLVDSHGNTVYHLAASHNRKEVLEALYDHAVHTGGTSCGAAAAVHHKNCVGHTPLMSAAAYSAIDTIQMMLSGRVVSVDINSRTLFGVTSLHLAVENRDFDSCVALVSAGASLTLRAQVRYTAEATPLSQRDIDGRAIGTRFGLTPFELAVSVGFATEQLKELCDLLTNYTPDGSGAQKVTLNPKTIKVIAQALLDDEENDSAYSADKDLKIRGGYIDTSAVERFIRMLGHEDITAEDVAAVVDELEKKCDALCQVQSVKHDTAQLATTIHLHIMPCPPPLSKAANVPLDTAPQGTATTATTSNEFFIDTLVDIVRDRGGGAAVAHLLESVRLQREEDCLPERTGVSSMTGMLDGDTTTIVDQDAALAEFIADGVVAFAIDTKTMLSLQHIVETNNPQDIIEAASAAHLACVSTALGFPPLTNKIGTNYGPCPPLVPARSKLLVLARKDQAVGAKAVHYLMIQQHTPAAPTTTDQHHDQATRRSHMRIIRMTASHVMARQLLVAAGATVVNIDEAATFSLQCANETMFTSLLSHGADQLSFKTILQEFNEGLAPKLAETIFTGRRVELLEHAVVARKDHVVDALLHCSGLAPSLMHITSAAQFGSQQSVQLLLPHLLDALHEVDEVSGETALTAAITGGNMSAVYSLLQVRAGINECNKTQQLSPLALASLLGHESAAIQLMSKGADVNQACGPAAITPLIASLLGPNPRIAPQLVANGACVHTPDNNGLTPILAAKYFSPSTSYPLLLRNAQITNESVLSVCAQGDMGATMPSLHSAAAALHSIEVHFHSLAIRCNLQDESLLVDPPFSDCETEIPHPSEDAPCNMRQELLGLMATMLREVSRVMRSLLLEPHLQNSPEAPMTVAHGKIEKAMRCVVDEFVVMPPMARGTLSCVELLQAVQRAARSVQVGALLHSEYDVTTLHKHLAPEGTPTPWSEALQLRRTDLSTTSPAVEVSSSSYSVTPPAAHSASTSAIVAAVRTHFDYPMTAFQCNMLALLLDPIDSGTTSIYEYASVSRALGGFTTAHVEAFCQLCVEGGVWIELPDAVCQAILYDRVPGHFLVSVGLSYCSVFFNDPRGAMRVRRFRSVLEAFNETRFMTSLRVPCGSPQTQPPPGPAVPTGFEGSVE